MYRTGYATVYIFENLEAGLVKVGITINNPVDRLKSLADLWTGRYGTCQVCGGRQLLRRSRLPEHRRLGARCAGSGELSLERDSSVAEWYLRVLQDRLGRVSGVELTSVRRMIKRLDRVIAQPRHAEGTIGSWRIRYEVFTERPEQVESLAHSFLAHYLEAPSPHGEVFRCGFEEARAAVERALDHFRVAQTAEVKLHG